VTRARIALAAIVLLAIAAFLISGGPQYLSFANLQELRAALERYYAAHRLQTLVAYFVLYVACTGLSLPGSATVLTLVGGAVFGFVLATVLVSFAASLGATLAFLLSRFILRDWVQERFGSHLRAVNEGIEREGGFYLFTLRLIPYIPYFAINLVMGLTSMRAWTFYWVGQLGMLAGTMVYVNAGTQLATVHSAGEILSARLVAAFLLLAFFPLIAKRIVDAARARRVYARWPRPRRFERNLVVIGAGSAGLVCAYIAAAVRAKVTLVEKHRMGGDCLNTGCVPSKALLKSARVLALLRRAPEFGLKAPRPEADFAAVMERVRGVVERVAPHDSVERYRALGVECLQGEARIASPWSVEVAASEGRRLLTTRSIVIAAGARPFVPPIPGIEALEVLTSDNVWALRELPRRLLVLGGGPVGCELAQAFARLGAQVTQLEMLPRILAREDDEVSAALQARLESEGVRVLTGYQAVRVEVGAGGKRLVARNAAGEIALELDALLCATGRIANTAGYGLEALGIPLTPAGTIATDEFLRTRYPNIYACGDVAGPYQFTHTASHQAWYATVNALFGAFRTFRADYSVIPWTTFTEPEVARVGLNEREANERNVPYEATVYGMDELDRAMTEGEAHGMVKVLTAPRSDRVLGATIVGEQAGELIAEFVLAMRHGIGLRKLLATIHVYPTLAEANKHAAGVWQRAHAPQGLLRHAERFHAWMRA